MFKFVKVVAVFLSLGLFFSLFTPSTSLANTYDCGYSPVKGKNPSFQEANCLLTNIAIDYGVPPEIVKAVATQENGTWEHFDENGEVILNENSDGGIGIMQITFYDKNDKEYEERLKNDVIFNIEEGVKRLVDNFYKRSDLPKINDHSPEKLESWYFAIMAYNGIKPINSPIEKYGNNGIKRNSGAYQEVVYAKLKLDTEGFGFDTKVSELPFEADDFQYNRDSVKIKFLKMQYNVDLELTDSKEMTTANDYVKATVDTNLREKPTTGDRDKKITSSIVKVIKKGDILRVKDEMTYDLISTRDNRFGWYHVSYPDNKGYVASKYLEKVGARLGGAHRYSTAVEISKRGWDQAETVILATGKNFPDALAGAPLSKELDAPILLTESKKLSWSTLEEIKRLGAKKVIILGSDRAVSKDVEKEIGSLNIKVERIAGGHRYATSVKIAERLEELGLNSKKAILAYGENFPDALAIAPYAARNGYPILLTKKDEIPADVKKKLDGKEQTIIVGDTAVISASVAKKIQNPLRLAGKDRYRTAVAIMNYVNMDSDEIFFANGNKFPDALTGSALAAKYNVPLLLVKQDEIPSDISNAITKNQMEEFYLLGSDNVIAESLVTKFESLRK